MVDLLTRLWRDRAGQDLIEYALMAALVATGAAVIMPVTVVPALSSIWNRVEIVLIRYGG
jgi:Flp pilus assembly pilin Flp